MSSSAALNINQEALGTASQYDHADFIASTSTGRSDYLTYGGTANALTLTSINTAVQTAYVLGAQYRFRATAINTAAATINIDTLGAIALKTVTGAALPAGYIRTDVDTVVTFDGVDFIAGREDEYGSNANGEFWRSASGKILLLANVSFDTTSTSAQLFYYPAEIASNPVGYACLDGTINDLVLTSLKSMFSEARATYWRITVDDAGNTTNYILGLSATGRWY